MKIQVATFPMTCQNTQAVINIGEKFMAVKTPQGIRPIKIK